MWERLSPWPALAGPVSPLIEPGGSWTLRNPLPPPALSPTRSPQVHARLCTSSHSDTNHWLLTSLPGGQGQSKTVFPGLWSALGSSCEPSPHHPVSPGKGTTNGQNSHGADADIAHGLLPKGWATGTQALSPALLLPTTSRETPLALQQPPFPRCNRSEEVWGPWGLWFS